MKSGKIKQRRGRKFTETDGPRAKERSDLVVEHQSEPIFMTDGHLGEKRALS